MEQEEDNKNILITIVVVVALIAIFVLIMKIRGVPVNAREPEIQQAIALSEISEGELQSALKEYRQENLAGKAATHVDCPDFTEWYLDTYSPNIKGNAYLFVWEDVFNACKKYYDIS